MNKEKLVELINSIIQKDIKSGIHPIIAKYSPIVMDHSIIPVVDISVDIQDDPYYSNTIVHSSDIDISGDDKWRFTGMGNLTINITTSERFDKHISSNIMREIFSGYIFKRVLKYFIPSAWKSFIVVKQDYYDTQGVNYYTELLETYDTYNWESIEEGDNQYWKKVESINEQVKDIELIGRNVTINNDGTVSIEDKNGKMVDVRMSVKVLGDINVSNITQELQNFYITGKKGRTEKVDKKAIETVISFVDNGTPDEIESGNPFKPNIQLTKV